MIFCFFFLPIIFLLFKGYDFYNFTKLYKEGKVTSGQVLEIYTGRKASYRGGSIPVAKIKYSFINKEGTTHTKDVIIYYTSLSPMIAELKKDSQIPVTYLADKPKINYPGLVEKNIFSSHLRRFILQNVSLPLIMFLIFAFYLWGFIWMPFSLLKSGVSTTGEIEEKLKPNSLKFYFVDEKGVKHSRKQSVPKKLWDSKKVGDKLEIIYLAKKPEYNAIKELLPLEF